MKKHLSAFALVFLLIAGFSCRNKNKDPEPAPQPEPVKTGKINFKITTYDSFGKVEDDHSGVKVTLVQDNISGTTDTDGLVSFSNLPYGNHTPVLEKAGYDGPLVSVALNTPEYQSFLPFPKRSSFVMSNFTANSVGPGAVYVSFNNNPPALDTILVAVAGSSTPDLSHRKFQAVELFKVTGYKVTDLEISLRPSFQTMLAGLDSGATFYVTVMHVSYGLYQGNLQPGPEVLGENEDYIGNFPLIKKWKN